MNTPVASPVFHLLKRLKGKRKAVKGAFGPKGFPKPKWKR